MQQLCHPLLPVGLTQQVAEYGSLDAGVCCQSLHPCWALASNEQVSNSWAHGIPSSSTRGTGGSDGFIAWQLRIWLLLCWTDPCWPVC